MDSFGPRGITNSCHSGEPAGRDLDAFGALQFLTGQPYVSFPRVALMGFSEGGIVVLNDIEPLKREEPIRSKFDAAIAFYPICAESGIVTVPTLILNGQLHDWSSAEACQKMMAQETPLTATSVNCFQCCSTKALRGGSRGWPGDCHPT